MYLNQNLGLGGGGRASDLDDVAEAERNSVERREEHQ